MSATGETDGFKSAKTLSTNSGTGSYVLLTTGATETGKKMNLYDVAGNLWELTTEAGYIRGLNYDYNVNYNTFILRGGAFSDASNSFFACFRGTAYAPTTYTNDGFRPVLFLQ